MNNPIVYPDIDAQGVETSPIISALFDREIDDGNIDYRQIVLIKKETDLSDNTIKTIPVDITTQRIDLITDNVVEIIDDGTTSDRGLLYRTKFIITPRSPLDQNADYSVIIPKELGLRSVFDVRPTTPGQSPCIEARGPYTGLIEDEYQITITQDGTQSTARYSWKRLSDNYQEDNHKGRRRFVEIDQGIRIIFPTGEYVAGDTYLIKVIPEQQIQKIYAWNFSTGAHNHSTPDSEHSDSAIDLPVNNPTDAAVSISDFKIESIYPDTGESMVKIGCPGSIILGNISVKTTTNTSLYNTKKIEILEGATLDNETITLIDDLITIQIAQGETLNSKVVDLINSAFTDLEASTLLPDSFALLVSAKRFSPGQENIYIQITFSKTIDPNSITEESIKIFAEDLLELKKETLYYSYSVDGNTLTINIED